MVFIGSFFVFARFLVGPRQRTAQKHRRRTQGVGHGASGLLRAPDAPRFEGHLPPRGVRRQVHAPVPRLLGRNYVRLHVMDFCEFRVLYEKRESSMIPFDFFFTNTFL